MHPSTTTNLSDTIQKLWSLDEKLNFADCLPQEELLGLLVAGSMVISSIAKGTTTTQFTDDEVIFVENLTHRIEDELAELYGIDEFSENSENEDWDS